MLRLQSTQCRQRAWTEDMCCAHPVTHVQQRHPMQISEAAGYETTLPTCVHYFRIALRMCLPNAMVLMPVCMRVHLCACYLLCIVIGLARWSLNVCVHPYVCTWFVLACAGPATEEVGSSEDQRGKGRGLSMYCVLKYIRTYIQHAYNCLLTDLRWWSEKCLFC